MKATTMPNAIVILAHHEIDGEQVLETTCRDYSHYAELPEVVSFRGWICGKTGWNSDTQKACYKSNCATAHAYQGEDQLEKDGHIPFEV